MCTPYTNAAATLEARAEEMLAKADKPDAGINAQVYRDAARDYFGEATRLRAKCF